ncbi:hypothetical protein BLOT_011606 [Blomia tropicalis]|nr:hypothetical protein BLOT_011606 [Blomia tropicalis]
MRIVQIQAYWYILIITTTTPTNILCDYYIAREENKIPDTQNPYQYDNYGDQEESEDYSILIIVFVIVIIIAGYFFFCPMTNPMRTMTTTMTSPQPIPSQTQGLSFTPVQNTTTTDGKNLTNNSTNIAIVSNENVETSGKLNKASPYSEIGQPQKPPEIHSNLFDRSTVGSETNVIKTVNS